MKALKIISHPAILVASFLLIIISGEESGGFYLLYILYALPHFSNHAVIAILGILTLVFALLKYRREYTYLIEPILNIISIALLLLSLFLFFYKDASHYNYPTFYQAVPIFMLVFFGIISAGFLVFNLIKLKLTTVI